MSLLNKKTSLIREKRLQAISAYYGSTELLLNENIKEGQFLQRVRTFSQETASDILYALNVVSTIPESAIVIHGAAGCGAGRLSLDLTDNNDGKWAVTNLNERDSIMGSDVKLREAIKQVYKLHHPKIVFVISTPIVAINNDDIETVVEELTDELGISIVPVYSDGFRSKIGTTGYDIVSHSIAKYILKRDSTIKNEAPKANYVNLLSVSENEADLQEVNRLLQELGLNTNVFPRYADLENIQNVKNASFSISINPDEADYPGKIFETDFQIPYIQSVLPLGIAHTSQWITDISIATGHKTEALELISREKEKLTELLKKRKFNKQKVFISLTPAYAIAVYDLLVELGFEVVGIKLSYIDQLHFGFVEKLKTERPDLALLVGEGQLFEEENLIQKVNPEIYIGGKGGDFAVPIRNGIPVINIDSIQIIGFNGVKNFVEKIGRSIANTSFTQLLAQNETRTYTNGWINKSTNWFIKKEVK